MHVTRTLFYLVTACCCAPLVNAAEQKRLETVKSEFQASGDETRLEYAFLRCSALQVSVSVLINKSGAKEAAEQNLKSAFDYINSATYIHDKVNKKRGIKEVDSQANLIKSSKLLVTIYLDQMAKNWASSGDHIASDAQLMNEVELCKDQVNFLEWMTN